MSAALESGASKPFVITVSARALFDIEESNRIFEEQGEEALSVYQKARENEPFAPGPAMPVVQKLLAMNALLPPDARKFEVILLSRHSADTGLRAMNTIEKMGLPIIRAIFTSGEPTSRYIEALDTQLFLSCNATEVGKAIEAGIGAATILPSRPGRTVPSAGVAQIRIAFDGDAVLFGDEAERAYHKGNLEGFYKHETENVNKPLSDGPFRPFLEAIHKIQSAFPGKDCPVRTALVTARAAPSHKRAILTLRNWGVRVDEAMFLGGRNKGPFVRAFGADLFFDDSAQNIEHVHAHDVTSGHVPFGVRNEVGVDPTRFTGGTEVVAAPPSVAPTVEAPKPAGPGRTRTGGPRP